MTKKQENARRLVCTLSRYSSDKAFVARLAQMLNYVPSQLEDDISDLYEVLKAKNE